MISKTVKFQYFLAKAGRRNGHDEIFDFNRWLHTATEIDLNDRIREMRGIKARLESHLFYDREGLWGLRFMRLREDDIPFIVKADSIAEDLELHDDEYVGEGLHILYDPNYQLLMVQVNRFSLGITALENYLNAVWDNPEEIIHLQPFQRNIDIANYRRDNYKTLTINFANLDTLRRDHRETRFLEGILDAFQQMGCYSAEIKFSLGYSRQPTLNRDQMHSVFGDISTNLDIVSSAKLSYKDNDLDKSEIINLLDCVEESRIIFNLPERVTLGQEYAFGEMIQEYNRRKGGLLAHLQN